MKAQGINIIIALGRFDYQNDQDIARTCAEVDLILRPETITVVHKRGKKIPLVKTYFCSKCVAKIQVKVRFQNISFLNLNPFLFSLILLAILKILGQILFYLMIRKESILL